MKMKSLRNKIIGILPLIILVVVGAGIVYAATSISATGGGAVSQITTSWGECKNIQNNNALSLFVPANTQAEWNAFVSYAPNKVLTTCCTANYGQACNSAANSCGQTNSGTYSCEGVCSASTPANPAGYGNACTSAANSCGQTNSGTIQCNGTCSASTPANPGYLGGACTLTSGANTCGQTQQCSGTLNCSNVCTGTCNPPANSCTLNTYGPKVYWYQQTVCTGGTSQVSTVNLPAGATYQSCHFDYNTDNVAQGSPNASYSNGVCSVWFQCLGGTYNSACGPSLGYCDQFQIRAMLDYIPQ